MKGRKVIKKEKDSKVREKCQVYPGNQFSEACENRGKESKVESNE